MTGRLRDLRWPVLIALWGLVLSLLAGRVAWTVESRGDAQRLDYASLETFDDISQAFLGDVEAVQSIGEHLRVTGLVSRAEFRALAAPILVRHPTLDAVGWVPRTPRHDRGSVEAAARSDGFGGFRIVERTGQGNLVAATERKEYFPLFYIEPSPAKDGALGFDVASEPFRRAAMVAAAASGETVATARIVLLLDGNAKAGFLTLTPVYRRGAPQDSDDQRDEALLGYVIGAYRIGDTVRAVMAEAGKAPLNIHLFDLSASEERQRLYPQGAAETVDDLRAGPHAEHQVHIGGRRWLMVSQPAPGWQYPGAHDPWLVLAGGLGLTILGTAFAHVLTGRSRMRAEAARVLEEQARELARSNAELEQFAYVASHDLREPLRMVGAYVGLLERRYGDMFDDEGREFIAFAREGAARMDRLILDLLEYSRIGRKPLPTATVSLADAVAEAVHHLSPNIAEAGALVEVSPNLPTVIGDSSDLVRLFRNLIANALKYCEPDRPPEVRVSAIRRGPEWIISVKDNGIGIDPQYFDRVFQIFQRLHTREHYEGTGIGLAVCRRIVEHHGGHIWIESLPGRGTTFHVALPAADGA